MPSCAANNNLTQDIVQYTELDAGKGNAIARTQTQQKAIEVRFSRVEPIAFGY